jgi:ABC-type transport system involved in multi-copper enzyme maturation permease subunit
VLAGVIVVALLLTSYACFAPYHALKDRDLQIGYGFIFNGLYMLLVGVLSATVIAQEKEGDTWNVLITSPLSARTMVMGKLLGVVRRMLWPTVLIVAHYAIFTIGRVISVTAFVLLIWVIVSFNSIWAATGVYLSLRVRKVTTAVIVNLMIPIVLFIAVPIALQAMGALLVRSDNWVEFVAYYLPYFYFVMTVNELTPGYSSFEPISMPVLSGPITLSSFIVLTIVAGIVHLLLAVIVVRHTIASFDAIVGRAKQT